MAMKKMDTAQMMEMMKTVLENSQKHLLAKMQENQAKSDADRKADRKERKADKEEMLAEMKKKKNKRPPARNKIRTVLIAWASGLDKLTSNSANSVSQN
jgi:hypothetical protein